MKGFVEGRKEREREVRRAIVTGIGIERRTEDERPYEPGTRQEVGENEHLVAARRVDEGKRHS